MDRVISPVLGMLPDISAEASTGEDLELHPDFGALERAVQGRPETQYGDTITPATPPDWPEAERVALGLLERTRDLRVLTHLAVARLHLGGLAAFAEILSQIRWQLEHNWQEVHPQLDPEDDNDPTQRANALLRLGDPANVLRPLRDLPLASTPITGTITWRELAVYHGAVEPEPGREKPSDAFIHGAFQNTNRLRLQELRDAAAQASDEVAAIPAVFEANAGPRTGPNLTELAKLLGAISGDLQKFEPIAQDPAEPGEDPKSEPAAETKEQEVVGAVTGAPALPRRSVNFRSLTTPESREDAIHLLELAANYFRRNEPSSPIPMLIDRACRLATKDFMEILRDLAPDGLGQAQMIAGPVQE